MKRVTITKLGVGSFAKVVGITQAVFAFVIGLIATISVSAGAIKSSTSFIQTLGISVAWLGIGVLLYPLIAFFLGWLQGAIVAIILNFVFMESGGLSVDTDEVPIEKSAR